METRRPVVMAKAERVDFESNLNHRRYSISVALPLEGMPAKGSPVLYVLDGDWYLGSAVEAVRSSAPGVVVVGIGYPDQDAYIESVLARHQPLADRLKGVDPFKMTVALERMYDLTLPASEESLARDIVPDFRISTADVGGLDAFLDILEAEVKPRVAAMASIDSTNQAIFGHSLGGLAVVHALFTRPSAFRTFIAASPSIWWNEKAVLGREARLVAAVRRGVANPRVLLTAGRNEETADPQTAAKYGLDFAELQGHVRKHRMIENACELTERLKMLRESGSLEVAECAVFPEQDHGIAVWPALGRAVSFAFP